MLEVFQSLLNLAVAVFDVVKAVFFFVLPYVPLISWISFWLLAVNWVKFYEVLFKKGGIVGFGLIWFMAIMLWGLIAPPADGFHALLGMHVSNYIAKTVYVTALTVIIFLCGSVQLSGAVAGLCHFDEPSDDAHESHGHGSHDDAHGHADHGHAAEASHGHAAAH